MLRNIHKDIFKLRRLAKLTSKNKIESFSTAAASDKILFNQHSDTLTEIVLNVPKTLNSLDVDMVDIMLRKLKAWEEGKEQHPRAVIVSGAGEKAFCAGGDIKALYEAHKLGENTKILS